MEKTFTVENRSTCAVWYWFYFSTGVNTIQAGNLDIELEYSKDGTAWATVQDATDLINPDALWEPGYTEVVYLRLSNDWFYNFSITSTCSFPSALP